MLQVKQLLVSRSSDAIVLMFRYGLVTLIAGPIDLGGYIILKSVFGINYVLAATISFTTSLIVNYLLSIAWVWRARSGKRKQIDAIIFALIGLVGLILTDIAVWVFTHFAGFNYIVSKLIALFIVFFWSFSSRHLLFKNNFDIA